MAEERIYSAHDNTIDLNLLADGSSYNTTNTTAMWCKIDNVIIKSSNASTDTIRWNQAGYSTSEVRLSLGDTALNLTPGTHEAYLTIFDSGSTGGTVWGKFIVRISTDVMAT